MVFIPFCYAEAAANVLTTSSSTRSAKIPNKILRPQGRARRPAAPPRNNGRSANSDAPHHIRLC